MTEEVGELLALVESLGAPPRLLEHLGLVGEAAEALIAGLEAVGVPLDARLVRFGAACHDAGKIVHPEELDGPGSAHEAAGEALLAAHGVAPEVARCCRSHAGYATMAVSFEELLVALADKLWKGVREEALELRAIDAAADRLSADRWAVYGRLDDLFERIAAEGGERVVSTGR